MSNTTICRTGVLSEAAQQKAYAAGQTVAIALLRKLSAVNSEKMNKARTVRAVGAALETRASWSAAKQGGFAHVIGDWLATAAGGACYDLDRYAKLVRTDPEAFGRDS